jgi:putrescine importer
MNRPRPLRTLGFVEVLAGGLAFIAPAFSLAAGFPVLATTGGAWAPIGIGLGTLLALLTAACFMALSRRFPREGGTYALVTSTLGPAGGFAAGWSLGLLYFLGPAIPLYLAAEGLGSLSGWSSPADLVIGAVGLAVAILLVNLGGARPSNRVALGLFLVEAGVLLTIAVSLTRHPGGFPPLASGASTSLAEVGGSGAAALFLFLGFDSISTYGEETHQASRTLPRATWMAIVVASVIYIVCSLTYLWAIPLRYWEQPTATLAGGVAEILGPTGGLAMQMVIIVSSLGTLLAVQNAGARSLFAMSRDRLLPPGLSRLWGRRKTFGPALGVCSAIGLFLTLWDVGGPGNVPTPPDLLLGLVFGLVVLGALVAYMLMGLSVLRFSLNPGSGSWGQGLFHVGWGTVALTAGLLVLQVISTPPAIREGLGVGAVVWFLLGLAIWRTAHPQGRSVLGGSRPHELVEVGGPGEGES